MVVSLRNAFPFILIAVLIDSIPTGFIANWAGEERTSESIADGFRFYTFLGPCVWALGSRVDKLNLATWPKPLPLWFKVELITDPSHADVFVCCLGST